MPLEEEALFAAVGARIKALRLAARLTQPAAAERFGCQPRYYQRIERGRLNLSLRTVARLAEALGVRPRELLP